MAGQVDWDRVVQASVVPIGLALIGLWQWLKARTDKAQHDQKVQDSKAIQASDNRALREMDIVREEWNNTKLWWTAELKEARDGEERCERKYHRMQRWCIGLAGKWNAHHPEDQCELPDFDRDG